MPNRLRRAFRVRQLNRAWASDVTACWTREGWCYLAVVMDLASRRIVGWSVRRTPTSDLRSPRCPSRSHDDRRARNSCISPTAAPPMPVRATAAALAQHRITPSMSRAHNCWDNAPVESFFSSLKTELKSDTLWADARAATAAIGKYIAFYNRRRLHLTLDYQSPVDFEAQVTAT